MRSKRLLACCGLMMTLAVVAVVATSPQPPPLAKFPGGVVSVLRQLDGSTVCSSSDVFLAADDPHRWAFVPVQKDRLPKYSSLRPIGGDRSRLFFVNTGNASSSLVAVSAGGRTTVLRSMPGFWAAFANGDVGAIAGGSDVFITGDGGGTWNQAASLESGVEVSALTWVSDSRLLVGGAAGSVELMERRDGNKLRRVWAAAPAPRRITRLALDGEYVWAEGQSLQRLSLADGHVDATVKPEVHIEALAACHQRLLISGTTWENRMPAFSISIWAHKADGGYELQKRISVADLPPEFLPLKAPGCLVITHDGKGWLLDLGKNSLSPLALQITGVPVAPPPAHPNAATWNRVRRMEDLRKGSAGGPACHRQGSDEKG